MSVVLLWAFISLAELFGEQGHEVRLMPAHYVRPYVTNKNDYIDAEAITEAVGFVYQKLVSENLIHLSSLKN